MRERLKTRINQNKGIAHLNILYIHMSNHENTQIITNSKWLQLYTYVSLLHKNQLFLYKKPSGNRYFKVIKIEIKTVNHLKIKWTEVMKE